MKKWYEAGSPFPIIAPRMSDDDTREFAEFTLATEETKKYTDRGYVPAFLPPFFYPHVIRRSRFEAAVDMHVFCLGPVPTLAFSSTSHVSYPYLLMPYLHPTTPHIALNLIELEYLLPYYVMKTGEVQTGQRILWCEPWVQISCWNFLVKTWMDNRPGWVASPHMPTSFDFTYLKEHFYRVLNVEEEEKELLVLNALMKCEVENATTKGMRAWLERTRAEHEVRKSP